MVDDEKKVISLKLIDEFVEGYIREFDYYQEAARLCHQRCEALLGPRGIRAIVTHRAKAPNKLRAKLLSRSKDKPFSTAADIRADIVDLAGVRIALYFPGDRERVEKLIQENFNVELTRIFPDPNKKRTGKVFSGYHATHFRLFLQPTTLPEHQHGYTKARIEIQLGSVLMHAWAEVEHDLVYKPESGDLSAEEHAILDELNGMVLAGEIALERLQHAVERRLTVESVTFDSHYELAAYLDKVARNAPGENKPQMGRVDALWELLKAAGITGPSSLRGILQNVDFTLADKAISDQITDAVLLEKPDLLSSFVQFQTGLAGQSEFGLATPWTNDLKAAIGEFLTSWIVLERTFELIAKHHNMATGKIMPFRFNRIISVVGLPSGTDRDLTRLRAIRNHLVHGIEVPSANYIRQAEAELKGVLRLLEDHSDPVVRDAYRDASGRLLDRPE